MVVLYVVVMELAEQVKQQFCIWKAHEEKF